MICVHRCEYTCIVSIYVVPYNSRKKYELVAVPSHMTLWAMVVSLLEKGSLGDGMGL